MKSLKITFIFLISSFYGFSQTEVVSIETKDKEKSGNYKDILSNMYQLVTTNLTGKEKTLEFNSTLFALKNTANSTSLENYNDRFARNLQFNFKVNLDDNFKYESFNGGLTYAIINQRDKESADFAGSEVHNLFNAFSSEIESQLPTLMAKYDPAEVNAAIAKVLRDEQVSNFSANENLIRQDMLRTYDLKLNSKPVVLKNGANINNTSQFVGNLHNLRNSYLTSMESKSLLTINIDGSANKEGKFNKASLGTIFLRGNKTNSNEIDLRATFSYVDTLSTIHLPRTNLNLKGGINFKIGKRPNEVSYFEVKATGEYNKIFNNLLVNEDEEVITANAEIRVRILRDVWIPLTIKYDIEKSNFLGFLNITYNFENL